MFWSRVLRGIEYKGDVKMARNSDIGITKYASASMLLHKGPCIVKALHISNGATAGDVKVYDGENAKGELKAHFDMNTVLCYLWRPGDGTDFNYGIYIAISSATTRVSMTYIPESRKNYI